LKNRLINLVAIVTRLITNRADADMRATFRAATRPLRTWFAKERRTGTAFPKEQDVEGALLKVWTASVMWVIYGISKSSWKLAEF